MILGILKMAASQWVITILHTLIIFQVGHSIYFFDDETRRSEIIDSKDFFREIEENMKGNIKAKFLQYCILSKFNFR